MKTIKLILIILGLHCFLGCEPVNNDLFITERVFVNASLENNSENINLGDTIKISLRLPDTILNNAGQALTIQTLQRGQFGMRIVKMDTATRTVSLINAGSSWVLKGSREGNLSFIFSNAIKPFESAINIKPPARGLYRIEIINQPGKLKINSNYEANLFVNFAVPDKHLNILSIISPYFGGQVYYDGWIQHGNEGFGVYFFRVI